jgi:hypothetical protein
VMNYEYPKLAEKEEFGKYAYLIWTHVVTFAIFCFDLKITESSCFSLKRNPSKETWKSELTCWILRGITQQNILTIEVICHLWEAECPCREYDIDSRNTSL